MYNAPSEEDVKLIARRKQRAKKDLAARIHRARQRTKSRRNSNNPDGRR